MNKVLHEVFAARARVRQDAIAVKMGQETLTYRELEERSNEWAARLRGLGVQAETTVALYLERSPAMVAAILGVLKAGGCYVPIDLAYPKERAAFMLEDAAVKLILTQKSLIPALPNTTARVIAIDTDWVNPPLEPLASISNSVTESNAAYIIYTSGSTGKPKGVVVTHHNVVRLLEQTEQWYGFKADDVWPLFHSYAFDVSVWELWGSLLYGGRLIIVPYLVSRSPMDFYHLLAQEKVTVLNQTPSAFRQLIWAETQAQTRLELSLRYVICAGEALELQSLKPWFELHGDTHPLVVNMYGITETTVHSMFRPIRKEDLTNGVGSVIGVPIPDLQIHLLDDNLKPVPAGVAGEIFVGGEGVARGYINRDELTSQRFLPDPFSRRHGARMYRSGDIARVSERGEMEYLGRRDHQVKIRGFRVELGEIESALNRHPAIRESVVQARMDANGQNRVAAYIVPTTCAPNVTALREHLARLIPEYMIPAQFIVLTALPLNTNGKVDRAALPAPDTARPEQGIGYVAPRNEIEKLLAGIWEKALGVAQVGVFDNFFDLGGDSIRTIAILSKSREHGLELSLQQMFEHPTVAGAAACAVKQLSARPQTRPFALVSADDRLSMPEDVVDAYPITRLQLGMFFHNELNPKSAVYHDVFSFRIEAAFDRGMLTQALHRLMQRHPVLRSSFHIAGFTEALQLVHSWAELSLTVEDLRGAAEADQEAALVKWIEEEKRRPFDRTKAPLLRFHAQCRAPNLFQFIVSFHHACLDGWSLAAMLTEIFQDYAALQRGENKVISPPRAAFREYVHLEQQSIASADEARFWKEKLEGTELQRLARWPQALREGGDEQARGPEIQIDDAVTMSLKDVARQAGVPLKTVLLAAHQRVISFLYGQKDVTSGLLCNGRPEELDGEKVIGLFLNTIPFRLQLHPGSWIDLAKQTFAAELETAPHRRVPMAEIQKWVGGRRLFEVAFDFVHFHVYNDLEGGGLDLREGRYFEANDLTAFTTFMLDASGKNLEFHIDYDPNELCRKQIEEMSGCYTRVLQAIAANPQGSQNAFSPMSDAERELLLIKWNQTEEDYPREECIHQLYESRVMESPLKTSLVYNDGALTYRELNSKANDLARRLIKLGVGPNTLVGIYLERSAEMVTAVLGILKAGGAYVPLDPAFPKERLAYMLEDARPRVLVTDSKLLKTLPRTDATVLCVDALSQMACEDAGTAETSRRLRADDLAYVIYTSGSTGKPKGVEVTHRAVVNLLTAAQRKLRFTSADKLLSVTTLSFDIAGLELFLPLISAGQIVLASREATVDGAKLAELIASSGATVMQATPATWNLLIESGWQGKKDLRILCGGESLPRPLADQLLSRAGEVWNFYGPTETTIWSTAWKVIPEAPISIGRPLANTRLYALDSQLQPTPVGVAGELHIGGDGVARGYRERPELNAEKFISDPFRPDGQSRLYKTGDWVRYQPDGNMEWVGRMDHQLKIRGFRIELGEIETALRQHPAVTQAVVTARDGDRGEKRLAAYFVVKEEPPSQGEIREFLRGKLPAYMVPTYLVVLPAFPLTPNGKIDRSRLPSPGQGTSRERTRLAPRNEQERALAAIWQEALAIPEISVDDDVFELGADSLSATRAFARIKRHFGVDLPLRAIFENPTVAALAGALRNGKPVEADRPNLTRRRRRLAHAAV